MIKAIFVADTRSLYYGVKGAFPNHSLNYLDVIKQLEDQHKMVFTFRYAFGKYDPQQCHKFATLLRETGFEVYFDRKYYDAELALKVAGRLQHVDAVVLASCWWGHFPVLEFAKENGKMTHLVTVNPPRFVNYYANVINIKEDVLRKKDEVDKPTE